MEHVLQPEIWIAFLTLASLEIVLGIDNIVFISILADRLPHAQQPRARTLGLALAMLTRIALLFSISWLIGLTQPLLSVLGRAISVRDVILGAGCSSWPRPRPRSTPNWKASSTGERRARLARCGAWWCRSG
jgi:predicted tellurium resistance membrane protein TerC